MIILSSSIVLSPLLNPLNTPIFGWLNIPDVLSVVATSQNPSFLASNVANVATNLRWQEGDPGSPPDDQYLTFTITQVDPIDYLAFAVHNLGTMQIPVSVEGATQLTSSEVVTATHRASLTDTADLATYTFNAAACGPALAGRRIVLCISFRDTGTTADFVSVTVNGNAATQVQAGRNDGGGNMSVAAIYEIVEPVGTTCDIVITLNEVVLRIAVDVYSVDGASQGSSIGGTSIAPDPTATLNVPAGGCVIGCANSADLTLTDPTNLIEDREEVIEGSLRVMCGHNNSASGETTFAFDGASVTVGAFAVWGQTGGPDWFELVQETILPNDNPVIARFTPTSLIGIRLRMQPPLVASALRKTIAVVYIGKLLVAERGTHTDHIPINFGRGSRIMNGKSETGQFLGRVVLSESQAGSFALQRLRAVWYRTLMDPFIVESKTEPFFFAWKPQEFPNDVGYCWMTNDPQPSVHFDTGTMAIDLQMGAVSV